MPAPGGSPGAGELSAVVQELNRTYLEATLVAALRMAQVMLRAVDGDEGRLMLGKKDPTLRAIAEHPGLRFSDWVLWSAIGVHFQWQLLSEAIGDGQLSLAHHRLLLAIPSPTAKWAMAERAVESTLSSRELAEEVHRWRAAHHLPPMGRPPLHPVIAGLRRASSFARRALDAAEEGPLPRELAAEADRLLRLAEKHLAQLRKALVAAPRRDTRRGKPGPEPRRKS